MTRTQALSSIAAATGILTDVQDGLDREYEDMLTREAMWAVKNALTSLSDARQYLDEATQE